MTGEFANEQASPLERDPNTSALIKEIKAALNEASETPDPDQKDLIWGRVSLARDSLKMLCDERGYDFQEALKLAGFEEEEEEEEI